MEEKKDKPYTKLLRQRSSNKGNVRIEIKTKLGESVREESRWKYTVVVDKQILLLRDGKKQYEIDLTKCQLIQKKAYQHYLLVYSDLVCHLTPAKSKSSHDHKYNIQFQNLVQNIEKYQMHQFIAMIERVM